MWGGGEVSKLEELLSDIQRLPQTPAIKAYAESIAVIIGIKRENILTPGVEDRYMAAHDVSSKCWQALTQAERAAIDKIAGIQR